ncbi:MAG: sugar isomerase domain-containing protein [Planctomycetes bacterium]|nr:sugar isomerase domain-containing protein [Planctomycetota bacterium]
MTEPKDDPLARFMAAGTELPRRLFAVNAEALRATARAIAERLARGGRLFTFGCGHSGLAAQDVYYRAGGLMDLVHLFSPEVELDLVPPERSSLAERRDDWLAERLPEGGFRTDDVLVVVSTSGLNLAPVGMALLARAAGALLVAIGSREASSSAAPRHPSGRRLHELADHQLDNLAPPGDTLVELEDGMRMGSTSTAASALLLQALTVGLRSEALGLGLHLPVYVSGNAPGGLDENRRRRG